MNKSKVFFLSVPVVASVCGLMMMLSMSSCGTFCAGAVSKHKPKAGQVEHVVLVWLKKPGDAKQRAQVVEAAKTFKNIPGVVSVSTGEVLPSDRPIVDDSFDVGTVIRFESKAALDGYGPHAIHQKAVNEVLKPLAGRILIYDYTVK